MTRRLIKGARHLTWLVAVAVLVGCGGSEAPGTSSGGGTVATPTISVGLFDPLSGAPASSFVAGSSLTATAILNRSGQPVANTLVTFGVSGPVESSVQLTPASGITDAQGRIVIQVSASRSDTQGGGTLQASAAIDNSSFSATADFQVTPSSTGTPSPSISVSLSDPLTGLPATSFVAGASLRATATITSATGQPQANVIAQIAAAGPISTALVVSPSSGLTDAQGRFAALISTSADSAQGAATLTATATVGITALSAQASLQVNAAVPPSIAVVLTNTDGDAANTATLASPLRATATVKTSSGQPASGVPVQFQLVSGSAGAALATLSPASGSGITDSQGRLSVLVTPVGPTAEGSSSISASANVGGRAVATAVNFQVGATKVGLKNAKFSLSSVQAFQTSVFTVETSGLAANSAATVSLSSPCVSAGKARLPASVVTAGGVATATYEDNGCGAVDTVTASTTGADPVQATITVGAPAASNIRFVSSVPDTIGIVGTGQNTSSLVQFQVVDARAQGVADREVAFALETSVGGVSLNRTGETTFSARTNASGSVQVSVIAGTQPGPVRVRARVVGTDLSALSSLLTIQSGLPVQSRFSVSVETFNIEGWNRDGTETSVTARAADRVGNPVPDGTVVSFRSSGAAIEPSCRTANGACSVKFRSQAPRPIGPPATAAPLPGRVSVLAYAVGEEIFVDANGNNRFDSGETFADLGDAFVDVNNNGAWNAVPSNALANEEFIPFNPAATRSCNVAGVVGQPSRANSCDGDWGPAHVRGSAQIVLSGSEAFLLAEDVYPVTLQPPGGDTCTKTLSFRVYDVNFNPMPAGTTISASGTNLGASVSGQPVVNTLGQVVFTNANADRAGTPFVVDVSASDCSRAGSEKSTTLNITIRTPSGVGTIYSFPIRY